jgi:hypothetical protein
VESWLHGGSTSMENLVQLCTFHHHLVHEGGWRVSAQGEGVFCFHSPMDIPLAAVPAREQQGDALGWLRGWEEERGLEIGPWSNLPQGDGRLLDYRIAVEGLLDAR